MKGDVVALVVVVTLFVVLVLAAACDFGSYRGARTPCRAAFAVSDTPADSALVVTIAPECEP